MLNAETYVTKTRGIGGKIREKIEDFYVEEIPLIKPSGKGQNVWIWIEKRNRTTLDVVIDIAKKLHIDRRRMGFAGMKDKYAVARQWICVSNIDPDEIKNLKIRGVKFLKIVRHEKKLRLGQLIGNKFRIIVRNVKNPKNAAKDAKKTFKTLSEIGVPNYYGWQRFGKPRSNTHLIGKALIKNDLKKAVDLYVGNPFPGEPEKIKKARKLYDLGEIEKSYESMPKTLQYERTILRILLKDKKKGKLDDKSYLKAILALPKPLTRMFIHAYQSYLFNKVVSERCKLGINKYVEGDILVNNQNRIINTENAEKLVKEFKAHPTAPLYGTKVPLASGKVGKIEKKVLKEENLKLNDFKCELIPKLGTHGIRRPIRFRVYDTKVEALSNGVLLEFSIPKGCYATAVLREVMKKDVA
ncbi:tRNA pseudouridine synthase D TruD [Methanothermus fervidus DSM 2088]|uniref:Probable tRNA pseudouridine synthase D n=1 Tax=Methanothermus fervidus (strain ATCC 43054 / DSM 2088 / JCM 10308 / V24 S) TaxID=523846 RepID=E3GYB4_METFV|nr:tRNA pseudouridine(13) synthase TruD [Methanothermus fervidus]ADP77296.1 tRNA pseudouridine synthase D TruD [Methanothermus fervidus DSM 2088]